jgi:ABC-type antimicrobial peptide transport system permease subunit
VPEVRNVVASMDKNVPVYNVETMEGYLAASVARNRFSTLLLGLFGALALLLAAVGIYGVISHRVSLATHEIGVRVALGAPRAGVVRLVVGRGMVLVLAGAAIGVVGALGLTRFLSELLYGVKTTDPLMFGAALVVLGVAALAACYIPARRAAKVDPMVALRYE